MEVSKFKIGNNIIDIKDAQARDDVVAAMNAAQDAQSTADQAVSGLDTKQNAISYVSYTGDIDAINIIGLAWCAASSVSGTLPFSTGYFLLETFKAVNNSTYIQKAYKYNNTGIPEIAYRMHANSQWYPWKSITLS